MPADRLFHPRAGFSKKVSTLTDLQFRVWWTYQLAADDYGVMRRTAIAIQGANLALASRSKRSIDQAIDTLVTVGLLLAFEHQGEPFVSQSTWQDFQKIRYPRDTILPVPGADVLARCSPPTVELFQKHFRNPSEAFPSLPRAGGRETANGYRQTATGKRLEANGSEERSGEKPKNGACDAFELFWAAYPKHTCRDDALAAWTTLQPNDELVAVILAALESQRSWPQWTREGGRFIPAPAKWLASRRWTDGHPEPLAAPTSEITRQNTANAEAAKRAVRGRAS